MKLWKLSLRCIMLVALTLLVAGCSFWEEAARRKILDYNIIPFPWTTPKNIL